MNAEWFDLLGYGASGLVLLAFSLRSITALRTVAIASNLLFVLYAVYAGLMPVLLLHAVLLPLNLWRLWQAKQDARCLGPRQRQTEGMLGGR